MSQMMSPADVPFPGAWAVLVGLGGLGLALNILVDCFFLKLSKSWGRTVPRGDLDLGELSLSSLAQWGGLSRFWDFHLLSFC